MTARQPRRSAARANRCAASQEVVCPPGLGVPPNIHHQQDEAFYVLEGQFSLLSGDEMIEAGPGSFTRIPKGTLHSFKNTGESIGKLLFSLLLLFELLLKVVLELLLLLLLPPLILLATPMLPYTNIIKNRKEHKLLYPL